MIELSSSHTTTENDNNDDEEQELVVGRSSSRGRGLEGTIETEFRLSENDNNDEFAPLQSSSFDIGSAEITSSTATTENEEEEEEEEAASSTRILRHARLLLYLSHFFAQFSEGAWQFSLILFLAAVSNYQSLIIVSTYGMMSFAAVCLCGARVGRYVDTANRLFAAQRFIWTENICVIVASALCYLLLTQNNHSNADATGATDPPSSLSTTTNTTAMDQAENAQGSDTSSSSSTWWENYMYGVPTDARSVLLLVGIHFFGPLAQIMDRGFLVAIERDWIVVMSQQVVVVAGQFVKSGSMGTATGSRDAITTTPKEWLSATNVTLKQIDLSCRIVAPAVAGFVIGSFGRGQQTMQQPQQQYGSTPGDLAGAAILVGVLNVISLVVEYACTKRIYHLIPALADRGSIATEEKNEEDTCASGQGENDNIEKETTSSSKGGCWMCCLPYGLNVYFQQPIAWGGFGLAMLYVNALTFGGLMTAFLVWKGMSVETVGLWRGVSSAIGLLGTFVYRISSKRLTVVQTGQWSIMYLFGCLSLCFGSFFIDDYLISMTMLITGACSSRIGLWVFDISITQLMQEFIPDGIRGVVGGTQQALNAFFQLFSFSLGLFFPSPRQFYIFAAAGYISIGSAMALYMLGVFARARIFRMPNEK